MSLRGHCLCGAVTYTGRGAATGLQVCHCPDCARWVGGPFMAFEFEDGVDIKGPVIWFQSSDWAERGTCRICASALIWRMRDGSAINIAAGSLDKPDAFAQITEHIHVEHKPQFYAFQDDAPRLTGPEVIAKYGVP